METTKNIRFRGPHLGALSIIFAFLFIMGLSYVVSFSKGTPHFPGPWESNDTIVSYFRQNAHDVLMCSFLQFCSAIPLGLYTVTVNGRLRFLGIKAVGPHIALFGGFLASFTIVFSSILGWTMSYPGVADDASIIRTLYYAAFGMGGVGYSVPLGLLIAGIAVSCGFAKKLPKWLIWSGIFIAVCGELSCLTLIYPKFLPLIPLTRFPGFIWLIIVGFALPQK